MARKERLLVDENLREILNYDRKYTHTISGYFQPLKDLFLQNGSSFKLTASFVVKFPAPVDSFRSSWTIDKLPRFFFAHLFTRTVGSFLTTEGT